VLFGAVEAPEEIEMPPGTAELAVGDGVKADVLLLLDDALDFAVFDFLQLCGVDLAFGVLRPRIMNGLGTEQAADMVGAERRLGLNFGCPPAPGTRAATALPKAATSSPSRTGR
jgi:hypothetical protein